MLSLKRQPLVLIACFLAAQSFAGDPPNFNHAKVLLKGVYVDNPKTFYCDCDIRWVGRSGGRVDHASCGFEVYSPRGVPSDSDLARAARSEVEHIVPVAVVGRHMQCWQEGGRENCQKTSSSFNKAEADLFNLTYAVGQVNQLRSDYPFGVLPTQMSPQFGSCDISIDTKLRLAQPRPSIRGDIARTYFYMADRYNIRLSRQDQQLYMAWHRQDPVSSWELTKHERIARITGRTNPFITGEKEWSLGFRPSGSSF